MEASSHFGDAETKNEEELDQPPELRLVTENGLEVTEPILGAVVLGTVVELGADWEEDPDDDPLESNLPPYHRQPTWTMSDDVMLKAKTGKTRQIWG